MEKTLTQEDRIRRAEEIYYNRNCFNKNKTAIVDINTKKRYKLFKRIVIQILTCIGIYFFVSWMQSNTNAFSIDSLSYIKSTLSYDVDINSFVTTTKKYMALLFEEKTEDESQEQNRDNESEEQLEQEEQKQEKTEEKNQENKSEAEALSNNLKEENVVQDTSSLSQMEQDAEYIKNNFSLIKPVIGTITSRFGPRNPTTPTVPKYHTGIDIAVNEGTVFIASMEGIVELVSSEGDYRKSCKNNE